MGLSWSCMGPVTGHTAWIEKAKQQGEHRSDLAVSLLLQPRDWLGTHIRWSHAISLALLSSRGSSVSSWDTSSF